MVAASKSKVPARVKYAGLPDKCWQMLAVALEDLEMVEKMPGYIIHMDVWHVPGYIDKLADEPDESFAESDYLMRKAKKTYAVCFAGSVMACSLNTPVARQRRPQDFPSFIEQKLFAVDRARTGDVFDTLRLFYEGKDFTGSYLNTDFYQGEVVENLRKRVDFTDYDSDAREFKNGIRQMITIMKKYDL